MHTLDCRDALDCWPQEAPADIDVSTLPAAGATSNPVRLYGGAPWVALLGTFVGLRVAYSSNQSYPVLSGSIFPYPVGKGENGKPLDLFLSRDTGGAGVVTIGRFLTYENARAWIGSGYESLRAAGGAALGPFPAASALSDTDPNPTTTRVGSNLLTWDVVNAQWVRAEGKVPAFNLTESGKALLETLALGMLWDSTKVTWGRSAMVRNSGGAANGGRALVEDGYKDATVLLNNVATSATGIKASYTCPSNRVAQAFGLNFAMRSATAGVVAASQIVRGGNTNGLGVGTSIATIGAATAVTPFDGPYPLQAADTIQINVTTAQPASNADFYIGVVERDAE